MRTFILCIAGLITAPAATGTSDATLALLEELRKDASAPFTAEAGRAVWFEEVNGRSCTSCHTDSPMIRGRHQKTGKIIEPMAPSVNAERLTDVKKMNKWFLRNCKWTFGRECTAQEKGDILVWLKEL